MTRPGRKGHLDTILDELHNRNADASVAYLAQALDLTPGQITSALAPFVKRNQNGPVVRVKNGIYRWVGKPNSVKARQRKISAAATKTAAITGDDKTTTIQSNGYGVSSVNIPEVLDVPAINRGGIVFPSPRKAGDAMVVSFMYEHGNDIYFVSGGKMWKAYAV